MDYAEALERVANHANRPKGNSPEGTSLSFALWRAGQDSHFPDLHVFCDDLLVCFEVINRELNTVRPSEASIGKAEMLSRLLVADVSSLLSAGWAHYWEWTFSHKFPPESLAGFGAKLVQLGMAWGFVLDGDIDNIATEVRTNFEASY